MAEESLKITIKKNGEILVDLGDADSIILQKYTQLFEEILGPVTQIMEIDGDPVPVKVKLMDTEREKVEEENKQKRKQQRK